MRVFSLAAGVTAIGAAAVRHWRSLEGLERIAGAIGDPAESAIVAIVWHALTYVFAVLGVALIVSARASRETALSVALLATAVFGGVAAMMLVYSGAALGDPFAFWPVFVLAGVAALSALAAARA